ncbi:MAG TPA: hypothetical protein VL357_06065 [Rariglobus sp.]|jgi:hypothetical protein|nr:hypothetical protein [Rariglobus sp.]
MALGPTTQQVSWSPENQLGQIGLFPFWKPQTDIAFKNAAMSGSGVVAMSIAGTSSAQGLSDMDYGQGGIDPLRRWKKRTYVSNSSGSSGHHPYSSTFSYIQELVMNSSGVWQWQYASFSNGVADHPPLTPSFIVPVSPPNPNLSIAADEWVYDYTSPVDEGGNYIHSDITVTLSEPWSSSDMESEVAAKLAIPPAEQTDIIVSCSRSKTEYEKRKMYYKNTSTEPRLVIAEKLTTRLECVSSIGSRLFGHAEVGTTSLSGAITHPLFDEFGAFSTVDFRWDDVPCYRAIIPNSVFTGLPVGTVGTFEYPSAPNLVSTGYGPSMPDIQSVARGSSYQESGDVLASKVRIKTNNPAQGMTVKVTFARYVGTHADDRTAPIFSVETLSVDSNGLSQEVPLTSLNLDSGRNNTTYFENREVETITKIEFFVGGVLYDVKDPPTFLIKSRRVRKIIGWQPYRMTADVDAGTTYDLVPSRPRYATFAWATSITTPFGSYSHSGTSDWDVDLGIFKTPEVTVSRTGLVPNGSTQFINPAAALNADASNARDIGGALDGVFPGLSEASLVSRSKSATASGISYFTPTSGAPIANDAFAYARNFVTVVNSFPQADWLRKGMLDIVGSATAVFEIPAGGITAVFDVDPSEGQGIHVIPHVFRIFD